MIQGIHSQIALLIGPHFTHLRPPFYRFQAALLIDCLMSVPSHTIMGLVMTLLGLV